MLKILAIGAVVIVVLIAAVLVAAALRPDEFQVARSTRIQAPAEKIYPLISDLRAWEAWSPFEKLDSKMKKNFSGSTSGKGAVYEWEGNADAGSGRVEVTAAKSPEQVTLDLHMIKPFGCRNVVVFDLQERAGGTEVTWTMSGPQPFLGKVMSLFMNMDTMVGGQFEEGLAKLKSIAEGTST